MENRNIPLFPGCYYHVYNRGNNREKIFFYPENYRYFLVKYDEYLSDFVDTLVYCLLPNHFHFLIRVKENPAFGGDSNKEVSEAFRRFFTCYSKSINKQEGRTGSLFQKNFRRKQIENDAYFVRLVYYIHANPSKHSICSNFREYPHSSYNRMLLDRPSKLAKQEVLSWFGSKEDYINFHNQMHDLSDIKEFIIED